jgi:hypothetical protein
MRSVRKARGPSNRRAKASPVFDTQAFLDSAGVAKTIAHFGRGDAIFTTRSRVNFFLNRFKKLRSSLAAPGSELTGGGDAWFGPSRQRSYRNGR